MTDWLGEGDMTGKVVRVTTLAGMVGRKGDAMKNCHSGWRAGCTPGQEAGEQSLPKGLGN